ncbi:MATE family efflux transporter [Halalkalibacter urbisdiaboli]|uniref:MATE family efflux transporter n=1 Tax=Halalkalibacter urbisdiaboli TaxID=1960589 RepID=UPI000B43BEE2|nr:MATE family efflux transporter [Halalkalibacter urbisdiaboli]
MEAKSNVHPLEQQSVSRVFFSYLIPSLIGMVIMAVNYVVDGIMVGNRLGPVALAGVGLAAPVYTIFLGMSLWIGIGGATLYSQAMGAKQEERARFIFTHSTLLIFGFTLLIGITAFVFREPLTYALGANQDTYPYAYDYLFIMLLFGFVFTIENATSSFVRNDGGPTIAMAALVVTAVSNVGLNYVILYILDLGVKGAAIGTIIAAFLGVTVLTLHFIKKDNNLRFVRFCFQRQLFQKTMSLGFPSFLTETGIALFTVSHNVVLARLAGTEGVAAFTVLNYINAVMLMLFLGLGSAIQPLISFYHGALSIERKKQTVKLALWVAGTSGILCFIIGQLFAGSIVAIFGDFPESIRETAISAIKLFFIAYLFMGANLVMMTYYQSIAQVRLAVIITVGREFILMLLFLLILPLLIGVNGVWLAIPLAELLMLIIILVYMKRHPLDSPDPRLLQTISTDER